MDHAEANRRGIACMVFAMGCYVVNDALVKLTLDVFPTGQVLAVRGLAATFLIGCIAWRARPADGGLRALWRPIMALRCGLEIATALASVLALARASLPLVTAVMMTAPLMVAAMSMAMKWEPLHLTRIAGILAGMVGALLILRPSPQASASGLFFAALCAASLACRDVVTRRLPPLLTSAHVALATTAAVCAAGGGLGLAFNETWISVDRPETLALMGAAVCSAAGNYALIVACRGTDLAVVTPFRYSIMVWSCILSYAVWRVLPDGLALAGIVMIVLAGLATLLAV